MKKIEEVNEYGGSISVKNANLWYGDFQALKNISVEIPEKQVTAFIGPSGCGKSTFLKCFNRMNDLVDGCKIKGEFYVGGTNIYGKIDVNELRKNVGMVFQKPNPFPMSVYDNIAYGPRTFGIRKHADLDEIVEKSLRQAAMWDELKDRLNKSALGLSGGQQQRVAIARALVGQPALLLADEPTGALDQNSGAEVLKLFKKLHDMGNTIVMITHDLNVAKHAERMVQIIDGEVFGE